MLLSANLSAQIYVSETAIGNNDGISWTDAYTDLQAAIDAASIGDEIWVAAGTYLPTDAPDENTAVPKDRAFHLNKNLKIYGGFDGTETMLSERDWKTNATFLSGDFMDDDMVIGSGSTLSITNNTENAYHVFITFGLDSTTLIDGFTVQGGNADGGSTTISYDGSDFDQNFGGGMYHINSSPSIRNSTFSENSATNGGGCITPPPPQTSATPPLVEMQPL